MMKLVTLSEMSVTVIDVLMDISLNQGHVIIVLKMDVFFTKKILVNVQNVLMESI